MAGVELAGPQGLGAVQRVTGAVWGAAGHAAVTLALVLPFVILALHLLLLRPLHVVNPHQQAVIHQLQLGQQLGGGRRKHTTCTTRPFSSLQVHCKLNDLAFNITSQKYTICVFKQNWVLIAAEAKLLYLVSC